MRQNSANHGETPRCRRHAPILLSDLDVLLEDHTGSDRRRSVKCATDSVFSSDVNGDAFPLTPPERLEHDAATPCSSTCDSVISIGNDRPAHGGGSALREKLPGELLVVDDVGAEPGLQRDRTVEENLPPVHEGHKSQPSAEPGDCAAVG